MLHSIPDCAEGGQLAKSRERDGGRGENISVANIMVNSDRVRRWLGATMCRAAGLGRFTAPLATSRRWFCLPYTLVESGGLEPRRWIRGIARTVPTVVTTRAYQKRHHRRLTSTAGGKAWSTRPNRASASANHPR